MYDLARTPEQLGVLIRRARKARRWSQTQLGERCGLRQETVSLVENGHPAARLETIMALLGALGLEIRVGPRTMTSAADLEDVF